MRADWLLGILAHKTVFILSLVLMLLQQNSPPKLVIVSTVKHI